MTRPERFFLSCCLSGMLTTAGGAAEFSLVPIDASGPHTIIGNEIILDSPGQRVFLEVRVANWDPDLDGVPLLRAFQASIDSAGYSSGLRGTLEPASVACGADLDCRAAFGGVCSLFGGTCVQTSDCAFPAFEVCQGSECAFPPAVGGFCQPGFIHTGKADYVFRLVADLPTLDLSTLDFRFASATQDTSVPDPGVSQYAATLVLDVPADASGTFTVGFRPIPASLLQDENNNFITPLNLIPALITVPCVTDADCDDGNECTQDTCVAGTCNNVNRPLGTPCGDPGDTDCDNPDTCDGAGACLSNHEPDGTAPPGLCDDGIECTQNNCLAGACDNPNEPSGTACGDPSSSECDNPDTCDGAGTCQNNLRPAGFPCGDPADTDCTNPDTCNGAGACLANNEPDGAAPPGLCDDGIECTQNNCLAGACDNPNEPTGTPCGDPSDTDCDNPDTCNGMGVCLSNNEPDGPAPPGLCDDGIECTQNNCLAAACDNPNEPTGTPCGDPSDTDCDNPDTCDGAGTCLSNNEPDGPAPPGLCNDGNDCTQDNCLAAACDNPNEAVGTACGDPADTDCDNPDTCDGAGICLDNLEPVGFACGDPSNTECTDPDTCDGAGTCLANDAPAGLACGDPTDTGCDNPDTCDGAGACQDNLEPNGTACDDGLFCNVGETCTGGVCGGGTARNCGDGIPCTTDTCNDATDQCENTLDAGFCLISGLCRPDGALNPGNDCEACNPAVTTVDWSFRPVGTACGDPANTDCTDPDTCDGAGLCLDNHAPMGTACGDASNTDCDNPDTCDGGGGCLDNLEPNGTPCDDGLFCNVAEFCTAGACGGGAARDCSDGITCTDDSCDEVGDTCVNLENDANCNNGQFCDGVEICDAVLDCIVMPGSVPDCDDLVGCTDDSCDEVGDQCVNSANDANCNNGQFCDGVEICDPVADCVVQPGSVPNPDDGIGCTDDSCDEVNDVIVNTPNDTLCPDDGLFCNGDEFCNAVTDCDHTGSPCGGPCDEVNDLCLCEAPIVEAVGSRYLHIALQPPDSGPQAIVITPDCPGSVPLFVCPSLQAVDLDGDGVDDENVAETGFLCGPANLFLTPAEWGDLFVIGEDIIPAARYVVQGDCGSPGNPGLSDPTTVTTPIFGDAVGIFVGGQWTPPDGEANILDAVAIVDGFRNLPTAPPVFQGDLIGIGAEGLDCVPDQQMKLVFDVVMVLDAFRGMNYRGSTGCPVVCR